MPESNLPALPAWQARSFWLTIIAAASSLSVMTGFDLFAFFGVENETALTDHVMEIVAAAAVIWAWVERRSPNYRLTMKPTPTNPEGT